MTPTKLNRAPLTKRISALAITAAAALSFVAFSPLAEAATPTKPTKEFNALAAELTQLGTNIDDATSDQLAQAVANAITDNPSLKPGNIAGEALKYGGNQDSGDEIATVLINASATDDNGLVARDAIKRAGSGKGLNVNMVPDFAAVVVDTDAEAVQLARLVISTKPGAGAVIGGRASEATTLDGQLALTNAALLKTNKLTAATIDILKYVVAEVALDGQDTADFTHDIAANPANIPLAAKIGTGGVAGDPRNGGAIVDALLSETALPKLKSGIASFIKAVAKVADIEEISKIALAVGDRIAAPVAGGTTTQIKVSKANGVVKSLAKAIVAKATTNSLPSNPNSQANKEDEIAEVVAGMVAKVINTNTVNGVGGGKPQFKTAKSAGTKILALIKSAVNATKSKKVQNTNPGIYAETAEDVAGSVAETLGALRDLPGQTIPATFFDGIRDYLLSKAKSIGGTANTGAVTAAINAGYLTGESAIYENGVQAPTLISTSDYPETDFRPN